MRLSTFDLSRAPVNRREQASHREVKRAFPEEAVRLATKHREGRVASSPGSGTGPGGTLLHSRKSRRPRARSSRGARALAFGKWPAVSAEAGRSPL